MSDVVHVIRGIVNQSLSIDQQVRERDEQIRQLQARVTVLEASVMSPYPGASQGSHMTWQEAFWDRQQYIDQTSERLNRMFDRVMNILRVQQHLPFVAPALMQRCRRLLKLHVFEEGAENSSDEGTSDIEETRWILYGGDGDAIGEEETATEADD